MEKTLELRVRAIIGPEMARLQQELRSAGLLGAQAGVAGGAAGREIEQGFQRGNRAAKDFNGTIQNTTQYLQLIKGVISAFLLYRGFSFLTQQAGQFTRTLVDVQHQVGLIQTQLSETGLDYRPDITRNIMRTAAETGASMESLARAEYEIVSANIKVADSYAVLDLAARAAVAGGLQDAELAFDAALSQANVFNIGFQKAFDLQFQTLKRGVFNYEQFTTVVGTLSEAFASMGQDAETANAALAAISQVFTGKQIERGATGLRNAVVRISEAPEDFERLGVAVTDVDGEFRNFIGIAEDLDRVLDGMSSSKRASVLKELFPDERERRGIGAFLGQLDQAEQFFVEQQFAAGALNDAYETANDSLLTQARVFEQNLTPAMEPFVDMMSQLLGIFNAMDKMLPGLNSTLLTTATVGAAVGAATLMTGGSFPLSQRYLGPGMGPMGMRRMPTGIGIGAASLIPAASFLSAQRGGAQAGDYFGSAVAGGLAGGTIGGLPGAAIGAAVSLAATAFGAALADEAMPVSQSFSERFSAALKENAGDVASAFTKALANNIDIAPGLPLFEAIKTGGSYRFEAQREGYNWLTGQGSLTDKSRAELVQAVREGRASTGGVPLQYQPGQTERMDPANLPVDIRLSADYVRTQLRKGFEDFATQATQLDQFKANENYAPALQAVAVDAFTGVFGPDSPISANAADFAVKMFEGGKGIEVFIDALQAASTGDFKRFLELTGQLDDASDRLLNSFSALTSRFEDLFTGDAELAAEVFTHMGTEGERLAQVFTSVGRTVQAFGLLQTLQAMTYSSTSTHDETVEEYAKRQGLGADSMQGWFGDFVRQSYVREAAGGGLQQSSTTDTVSLLESLGINPNDAGKALIDRLVADLGLVKGTFDTQTFVDALFAEVDEQDIIDPLVMGANDFADALFTMADGVRHGFFDSTTGAPRFFDSMGYTADQLEMFAEEFEVLNRLVRQKSLLEQMKSIADFAGVGDKGIQGAMDILRQEMVNSGKALFDLMSDPASLAELVAKMEFGDVTVDNSTQNSWVVRFSGDAETDPSKVARFADLLMAEMDSRTRRRGVQG